MSLASNTDYGHPERAFFKNPKLLGLIFFRHLGYTVAVYSWSIVNNFVIDVYCRCLEILCHIALSSIANYSRPYSLLQFGIKSVGIYSRHL